MECSQPSFWLDVTKTFIGALLGAGLAFGSTLYIQWRLRKQENIKAGNLALALLVNALNAFLSTRKALLQTREEVLKRHPNAPLWVQFKPSQYAFGELTSFDLSSLGFLFDKKGVSVVQRLVEAETAYSSLRLLFAAHRETRELIQQRHSELGVGLATDASMTEHDAKIGPHLIAKGNDLSQALLKHFADDERVYRDAFKALRGDLLHRYGDRFVNIADAGGGGGEKHQPIAQ